MTLHIREHQLLGLDDKGGEGGWGLHHTSVRGMEGDEGESVREELVVALEQRSLVEELRERHGQKPSRASNLLGGSFGLAAAFAGGAAGALLGFWVAALSGMGPTFGAFSGSA